MGQDITQHERDLYGTVWAAVTQYEAFSPGEKYAPLFAGMADIRGRTVLDAGCGNCAGGLALEALGARVSYCDTTDAGLPSPRPGAFVRTSLWEDLTAVAFLANAGPFDYAYCCDVLEHVPTALTMLCVQRLLDVARDGLFLSVSNAQDNLGVWVGEPLHKTVEHFTWWRDNLRAFCHVTEARDLLNASVFLVRSR